MDAGKISEKMQKIGSDKNMTEETPAIKNDKYDRDVFHRLAIEHSNEGVIVVQGDKRVFFNQKYIELAGYSTPEEIKKNRFFLLCILMMWKG